jgi:hypothetical protein
VTALRPIDASLVVFSYSFFFLHARVRAVDLLKMVVSVIQDSFYPFTVGLK